VPSVSSGFIERTVSELVRCRVVPEFASSSFLSFDSVELLVRSMLAEQAVAGDLLELSTGCRKQVSSSFMARACLCAHIGAALPGRFAEIRRVVAGTLAANKCTECGCTDAEENCKCVGHTQIGLRRRR